MRAVRSAATLIGVALWVLLAASAAWASGAFVDDDGNYHEPMIEKIAAAGITNGCESNPPMYCPGDELRRSEFAAFVVRAAGEEGKLPPYRGYFADVPRGSWFTPYVERLYELGLTKGCGTDPLRYCPSEAIDRAEMGVFLVRLIEDDNALGSFQGTFGDVSADDWFALHIERLYELGITAGCTVEPLLYCPDRAVLRDQAASFLGRTLDLKPEFKPPRRCDMQTAIPPAECEALEAFYFATGGPHWIEQGKWLEGQNPCGWQGVRCWGIDGTMASEAHSHLS